LKVKNAPLIQEGIDSLNKAIQLRPDYDDAMAYLNLMYRRKADVECDDLAARQEDLKTADQWVDKTLSTKKQSRESSPEPTASPWISQSKISQNKTDVLKGRDFKRLRKKLPTGGPFSRLLA